MKPHVIILIFLLGSGCRSIGNFRHASSTTPPQIRFSEQRVALHLDEGQRKVSPVKQIIVLHSENLQTYFPEQQFIQLVSSTDFPHYASVSVLVVEKTHLFTLLRNDDQVASFLHAQMPAPTQADQVRDFLELFAELRGYEIVAEKPEAQDTRIGEGRRAVPDAGRFDLEIGEDPHVWQIKASLRTDPTYSGSIYRYTFSLPRTDRRNLRVNRGELQFIEHLIR